MVLFCWMLLIVEDGKGGGDQSTVISTCSLREGGQLMICSSIGEHTSILTWIEAVRIR